MAEVVIAFRVIKNSLDTLTRLLDFRQLRWNFLLDCFLTTLTSTFTWLVCWRLEWPRFWVGIQSMSMRSQSLAGWPDTRCLLQHDRFQTFFSVISALLIAEIQSLLLVALNSSTNSLWFVITRDTRKKIDYFSVIFRPFTSFITTANHQTKNHDDNIRISSDKN